MIKNFNIKSNFFLKYELQEYFEKLGKNYYTDCLNFDEFEKKAMNEVRRLDNIEELRNAFITIDFSCKGFLTFDDFTKHFQLIAPNLCQNIVSDIFRLNLKCKYIFV